MGHTDVHEHDVGERAGAHRARRLRSRPCTRPPRRNQTAGGGCRRPACTNSWLSTSNTRITGCPARAGRAARRAPPSHVRRAVQVPPTALARSVMLSTPRPDPTVGGPALSTSTSARSASCDDADRYRATGGVPCRVGERLLNDAVDGRPGSERHRLDVPLYDQGNVRSGGVNVLDELGQLAGAGHDLSVGGTATVTGDLSVGGMSAVTGGLAVGGTSALTGNLAVGGRPR